MLATLLTIILALLISFLSTLDSSRATLYVGTTTLSGIPMFFVVFASMIVGVLLASLTTIKNLIESKLTIFGQRRDLKKSYKTTAQLQAKINKLEEDKLALKEQIDKLAHPEKALE